MTREEQTLQVFLKEYEALKAEQIRRIGFRDNLLYVTLGVFGAVISFSVSNQTNYYALLVVPWVCLILGWTYLVNDEKITAIGRYIRTTLVNQVQEVIGHTSSFTPMGWEIAHRSDKRRKRRKIEQLIVDEMTFSASGILALLAFWKLVPTASLAIHLLSGLELTLLLILGIEIYFYADLKKGR